MSQILRRFDAHAERIADQQKLAKILIETGEPVPPKQQAGATAPGDYRKLRGIPVFGVAGAMTGSLPHKSRMLGLDREWDDDE